MYLSCLLPSSHRRLGIGRGWILHADSKNFTCGLPFLAHFLVQRMFHPYRARHRALFHTATAKPAFIRIQDYWWFSFLRIWNENIRMAGIDTGITCRAQPGIKSYRLIRRCRIRYCIYFLVHISLSESAMFLIVLFISRRVGGHEPVV